MLTLVDRLGAAVDGRFALAETGLECRDFLPALLVVRLRVLLHLEDLVFGLYQGLFLERLGLLLRISDRTLCLFGRASGAVLHEKAVDGIAEGSADEQSHEDQDDSGCVHARPPSGCRAFTLSGGRDGVRRSPRETETPDGRPSGIVIEYSCRYPDTQNTARQAALLRVSSHTAHKPHCDRFPAIHAGDLDAWLNPTVTVGQASRLPGQGRAAESVNSRRSGMVCPAECATPTGVIQRCRRRRLRVPLSATESENPRPTSRRTSLSRPALSVAVRPPSARRASVDFIIRVEGIGDGIVDQLGVNPALGQLLPDAPATVARRYARARPR